MRRSEFANLPKLVLETPDGEIHVDDYPAIAHAYAEGCANGSLNVCRMIKLAAQRYLRMLDMAAKPRNEFYFSPEHVIDYCMTAEKLKHVESGMWELTQRNPDGTVNPHIVLEPWQIWIESAIQGFRRKPYGDRLVTTALEVIPRKNAKSLKIAVAAIFDLCFSGQTNPQVTIAASNAKQADRVFSPITAFIDNDKDLVEKTKVHYTQDYIKVPGVAEGNGIIKLTSKGEKQDGLNPSLAIFEEGHAGAASVWRVVDSAFGARPNGLRRMITTAGYRPEGPAYELIQEAERILTGAEEEFSFFAAIYTLDKEDYIDKETKAIDWNKLFNNDDLLEKANPMYGISLDPTKIKEARSNARRRADLRGEFARTRFNIWTASGSTLIAPEDWAACQQKYEVVDFIGQRCWMGVDLATVLDMCAVVLIFEIGEMLAVFAKFFLPEDSPTALDPDMADQFLAWADSGALTLTPGSLADHDRVREEVEALNAVFKPEIIACDPYQAHNTVRHLWAEDRPVMVYPNSARTMTGPTDDILGRIVARTLMHDGNPILTWHAHNVYGERRGNGSIMPRKEKPDSKRKIDGFVAMVMANGCRLLPDQAKAPDGSEEKSSSAYASGKNIIGLDQPQ